MKPTDTERVESSRRISRRALMLGGAQAAFAGVLALRMRSMQIEQADEYRLLAEENRINIRLLAPPRGIIFDRNRSELAENHQNFRIVLVREDAGDLEDTMARLRQLVALSDEQIEAAIRESRKRPAFVPVTIADQLSWEDFSRIAINAPALPGITPEVGLSRAYPLGPDFAHVLGYVGPVSQSDIDKLTAPDPLLQIPEFQIGKIGVEAQLEGQLRGSAGARHIEVNAGGRVMRELDRDPGIPGEDIVLTLDHRLQNFMQARLDGESAAAVAMVPETGEILAIASSPSFDPNLFVRGISVPDYAALRDNFRRPLHNKSVQGLYPPGSTFKMVTALAALEAGLVDPNETVFCPGHMQMGRRRFHCWKRGGHGHMDLHNSLKQSCDVYYYEMAQRLGIDRISETGRKLGLGVSHELPLTGVYEGLLPTRAWKQRRHDEPWVTGDTLNAAIGQGFVLASPLQLAVMTARIASGRAVVPSLLRSSPDRPFERSDAPLLDIDPKFLDAIRRAMYGVSNEQRGTARASRILTEGMAIAGKTGTSQVRNITAAERAAGVTSNEDLPWERRDHALFVGFAPHDAPQIAVSVVVEHGGGGSRAAAPVARDIILQALYGGLPPLEAYPTHQRDSIREMQENLSILPTTRDGSSQGGSGRA